MDGSPFVAEGPKQNCMTKLYLLLLCAAFAQTSFAQSGCPGCQVELPALPDDTLYLTAVPDGELAAYYSGDLSFRLPKSTTPVAVVNPDVSPGIDIDEIRIDGVTNLPPGLSWEASTQDYVLDEHTDGCVRLCGVPLDTGLFVMQVELTASISIIDEEVSFGVPIYIGPATSSSDGFALTGNVGCGSATVSFENLLPGNGNAGITYAWNFGDGTGSTAENPAPKLYDTPGTYPVDYRATFDTLGYTLTEVTVLAADCDDLIGEPDLFIEVFDPTGVLLYTSPVASGQAPPVSFQLSLPVETGNYNLVVTDDDAIGSDACGSVNFQRSDSTQIIQSGDLQVSIGMVHPVTTVESSLEVVVYPVPEPPVLNLSSLTVCPGEAVALSSDDLPGTWQWYRDTTLLTGADSFELTVTEPGRYILQYYSPDGCTATSAPAQIDWHTPPPVPEFFVDNNLLALTDETLAIDSFIFQWYQNGEVIEGADEANYCLTATAVYSLVITDPLTGCSSEWAYPVGIQYNPAASCTTPVVGLADADWLAYPNPLQAQLVVELPDGTFTSLRLLDSYGRVHYHTTPTGSDRLVIPTTRLATGLYLLEIGDGQRVWTKRLVKP